MTVIEDAMTNPITAWVDSIPDLPTDPTRRAMVIALKAVEEEVQVAQAICVEGADIPRLWPHLEAARIALTDALFPSTPRAPEVDRAELMRAKVLELLAGKMKVLDHATTEGLGAEAARAILDDQQLLNAIMPQIAELQVES